MLYDSVRKTGMYGRERGEYAAEDRGQELNPSRCDHECAVLLRALPSVTGAPLRLSCEVTLGAQHAVRYSSSPAAESRPGWLIMEDDFSI